MNRTRLISLGLALVTACAPLLATAAAPAAPPVSGTIQSVADGSLQLRTADMQQARVTLSPQTRIVKTVPAKLTELRSGDFIGTTAETRDGKLVSTEVHVFAEALRGTGEGHYPWNQPNTTMTNGAVATMTNGNVAQKGDAAGNTSLTVTYKGGQQNVMVPASTPVTRIDMAAPSDLKAGARVTVFGRPQADGSLAADMLSIAPGP
ncbi:MAG TPA: DUF5666 domain-containing protein [Steroidobacteraceae bacterium]|jgi:Cu/Ag efflux protein CusF|nr:DUF5666 domain-containing protein [Steroidobacteraceae bacterium]